jgi:sugar lactone lactonase YvrE
MSVPFGALPDDRGGFYVTDYEAHVIRYVDVNGAISTAAGTGERGYAGDGGPAVDAMLNGPTRLAMGPDGLLYFCDTNNNVVRRIEDDETISNVAGIGERGTAVLRKRRRW